MNEKGTNKKDTTYKIAQEIFQAPTQKSAGTTIKNEQKGNSATDGSNSVTMVTQCGLITQASSFSIKDTGFLNHTNINHKCKGVKIENE